MLNEIIQQLQTAMAHLSTVPAAAKEKGNPQP